MIQLPRFGAQYTLKATPNSNGMISSRLPQDKVAALVQSLTKAGQDVLILSSAKDALVKAGVPEDQIIDKGPKAIHSDETAIVLTEEDCKNFKKEFTIFKDAGLDKTYIASLSNNTTAKVFHLG